MRRKYCGASLRLVSTRLTSTRSSSHTSTAITRAGCDYCFGRIATMTQKQRAVSTGTLNVRGRMGSPDSEIYLCNAATVAASAIEGALADPRKYL